MMRLTSRQRMMLETNLARDKAEVLLAGLLNAQHQVDRQEPHPRCARIVRSESMDRAIHATKGVIRSLNSILELGEDEFTDADWALLAECEAMGETRGASDTRTPSAQSVGDATGNGENDGQSDGTRVRPKRRGAVAGDQPAA